VRLGFERADLQASTRPGAARGFCTSAAMQHRKSWILLGLIGLAPACSHAVRQAPASAAIDRLPATPAVPASPPSPPYRPLHKGGADVSTGVYIREDDDLFMNTAMPIVLRRTYNSGDGHSRQFGANTTHTREWWLYGDGDPRIPWADLILANGSRVDFHRISRGDTQANAVLRHDSSPTEFNRALLSWNGAYWVMKLVDGSLAVFRDCQTKEEYCALVERRDAQGHRIEYVRDSSEKLLRIQSEGQSISFDYDGLGRIVRAVDTSGHEVKYSYDERGRLVMASSSDGTLRTYGYDNHDGLIIIREPGRIIRNWFDESGRWSGQELRSSDTDTHPYVVTTRYTVRDGSIVEVELNESGTIERLRYNHDHYQISDTFDADGPAPATFRYDREERTNDVRNVTLSCGGSPTIRALPAPASADLDDEAKEELIRTLCGRASAGP
jgi:YD repeat-containing protein